MAINTIEDVEAIATTFRLDRPSLAGATTLRLRVIPEGLVGEDVIIDAFGANPETRTVSSIDNRDMTLSVALTYAHAIGAVIVRKQYAEYLLSDMAIQLWSGGAASLYAFTEAGLSAAIADSASGDTILLPPGTLTLTAGITIAAGVELRGYSRDKTIISADADISNLITSGIGSVISDMSINFVCQATGTTRCLYPTRSILRNLNVSIEEANAAANTYGIDGDLYYEGDENMVSMENVYVHVVGTDTTTNAVNLCGIYMDLETAGTHAVVRGIEVVIENDTSSDETGIYFNGVASSWLVAYDITVEIHNTYSAGYQRGIIAEYCDLHNCNVRITSAIGIGAECFSLDYNVNAFGCSGYIDGNGTDGTQDYTAIHIYNDSHIYGGKFVVDEDGLANTAYGLIAHGGDTTYAYNAIFSGSTSDVLVGAAGTLNVYSCQYATITETGTLAPLTGNMVRQLTTWHAYGGFQSESETITAGTVDVWYHITNATNDLFTLVAGDGISLASDVLTVANAGVYVGSLSINITGVDVARFQVRVYNVTQSAQAGYWLTTSMTGAGYFYCNNIPLRIDCNAGDQLRFEIRCITDAYNPTLRDCIFELHYLHD